MVLICFSVVRIKYDDQVKRVCLGPTSTSQSVTELSRGRNCRRNSSRNHGIIMLLTGLLIAYTQPVFFFFTKLRTTCLGIGMVHRWLGPPTLIVIKTMPHIHVHSQSDQANSLMAVPSSWVTLGCVDLAIIIT